MTRPKRRGDAPRRGRSRASLRRTLADVFGAADFRPGQEEIIGSVLAGRDTVAIMPTGAGKSLCYQLPALHLPGMTVVVSPLISLMKDQTEKLQERGIDAAQINSGLTASESRESLDAVRRDSSEFLLTTPERLADPAFLASLSGKMVDVFVVDEAHCVSQWGHDFRPSYLGLRDAIRHLGRPPVLALTATAPPDVVDDIVRQLDIGGAHVVNTGTYRPNLQYEVVQAPSEAAKQQQLVKLLREIEGSGIVYASTVKQVETIMTVLRAEGVDAARYHGRVPRRERHDNQDRFMKGDLKTIVATNAFGMGVDKPDIRFVVHYSMPGSLDAYYQESGRAGRDGDPARCVLLYRVEDRRTHLFFMAKRYPTHDQILAVHDSLSRAGAALPLDQVQQATPIPRTKVRVVLALMKQAGLVRQSRAGFSLGSGGASPAAVERIAGQYGMRQERDRSKLERMQLYAQTALCRWKMLLEYFGDEAVPESCGHCDNCRRMQRRAAAEHVSHA